MTKTQLDVKIDLIQITLEQVKYMQSKGRVSVDEMATYMKDELDKLLKEVQ